MTHGPVITGHVCFGTPHERTSCDEASESASCQSRMAAHPIPMLINIDQVRHGGSVKFRPRACRQRDIYVTCGAISGLNPLLA